MIKFIAKRLLRWLPSFVAIILLSFLFCLNVPGDASLSEDQNTGTVNQLIVPNTYHLPLFYFSLKPYNWNIFLNELSQSHYKDLAELLLAYSGDIHAVKKQIRNINNTSIALTKLYSEGKIEAYTYKKDISALSNLKYVKSLPIKVSGSKPYQILLKDLNAFEFHDNAWKRYIPCVYWIGQNNIFHQWLSSLINGDWGQNTNGQSVKKLIFTAFSKTLFLAFVSLLLAVMAIPLSVHLFTINSGLSKLVIKFLQTTISIPRFIWALVFLFLLANVLNWMDPLVFKQLDRGYSKNYFWYLVPAGAMVFPFVAFLQDQIQTQLRVEFNKDYVKTALAKGMAKRQVLYRHVLKNSLFPFITSITHLIPVLLSGSVLVERIFGIPGLGDLLIESLKGRDFPVIIGITFLLSIIISLSYLLGDILYQIFHPKVKIDS